MTLGVDLVAGPVIELALAELVGEIRRVKENAGKLKPTMEDLESTLLSLSPLMGAIEKSQKPVLSQTTTLEIKKMIEDGTLLVSECQNIRRWYYCKKSSYQKKLDRLHKSLLRLLFLALAHTFFTAGGQSSDSVAVGVPVPTTTTTNHIQQIKAEEGGLFNFIGGAEMEAMKFAYEYKNHEWKENSAMILKATIEEMEASMTKFGGWKVKNNVIVKVEGKMKEVEAENKLLLSAEVKKKIELFCKQHLSEADQREIESIIKSIEEAKKLIHDHDSNKLACCSCSCINFKFPRKSEKKPKVFKFQSLHLKAHTAATTSSSVDNQSNGVTISETNDNELEDEGGKFGLPPAHHGVTISADDDHTESQK